MKKLNVLMLGLLLLLLILGSCRRSESERFHQNMENLTDSAFEYIEPQKEKVQIKADTIAIESSAFETTPIGDDDESYMDIPDVPDDDYNKSATDYDALKMLSGQDDD